MGEQVAYQGKTKLASKVTNGWLCVGSETICEIRYGRRYKSIRMFNEGSADQKSQQLAGIYVR